MKTQSAMRFALAGFVVLLLSACMSPQGDNAAAQRQDAQQMRSETLAKLYQVSPQAREQIAKAEGYAVFSNVGVNVIFLSAGSGWGITRDNRSGQDVYMKMVSGGVGLGLGVKDFRGVFVFTERGALDNFVEHGWDASGQADAAAKSGDKGGAFAGAIDVAPGIKLYQITEHGLALQATIQGTKYWKDDDLNG
jgi:lipid-binding SYLF domain-containing protein